MKGTVRLLLAATALVAGLLAAAPAADAGGGPEEIFVNTVDDVVNGDGLTSLREAVNQANATGNPVLINLAPSTTYELDLCGMSQEDANASGDLDVSGSSPLVTIVGAGSTIDQTCLDSRVLQAAFTPLELAGVTITGGDIDGLPSTNGLGGGVLTSGNLIAHQARFTDNEATSGGGVFGTARLAFVEVEFDQNEATSSGAAITGNTASQGVELTRSSVTGNTAVSIIVVSAQNLDIENSTISGNTTTSSSSFTSVVAATGNLDLEHALIGLDAMAAGTTVRAVGNMTMRASVLANADPDATLCSVAGTITSEGRNRATDGTCGTTDLTDATPTVESLALGPLAPHDSATLTRVPEGGSPLVDVIPAAECTHPVDQRSVTRPRTGQCEIGPVEVVLRSDGHVRIGAGPFLGNDDYDARVANQVRETTRRRGQAATFVVRAENDGETVDDLDVRGLPGNANFTVRYRVGGTVVTGAVTSGTGYRFEDVPPGGRRTVEVTITPKGAAPHGANRLTTVKVTSGGGRVADTVGARVRVL